MAKTRCAYFLIYLTIVSICEANLPNNKCCAIHEVLKKMKNETYECVKFTRKTTLLQLENVNFSSNCSEKSVCADEVYPKMRSKPHIQEIVTLTCPDAQYAKRMSLKPTLRKCCPFGKVYNASMHKCTNATSTPNSIFNTSAAMFVKFGLPDCKEAIVDVLLNDFPNMTQISDISCVDITDDKKFVVRTCKEIKTVCDHIKCLPKCCPDGQSINKSTCVPFYKNGYDVRHSRFRNFTGDFAIFHAESCAKYIPKSDVDYYIDKDGILHVTEQGTRVTRKPLEMGYCMEYLEGIKDLEDGYYVCLCALSRKSITKLVAMCLSAICLLLTIIGYGCLPDLRNLFGKTLVCYCSSLLVAITCEFIRIVYNFSKTYCRALGYVLVFSFTAAFAWLTVICFDIWYQFSAMRLRSKSAKKDLRRFIIYNIFVWSLSVMIIVIVIFLNFYELLPVEYSPKISYESCFIDRDKCWKGDFMFFRTPIAAMMAINCYFFAKTIYYCIKVKTEINKMRDHSKKKCFIVDKERMMLCLKLFIIMGVLWIMEVVTAFVHFRSNKYLAMIEHIFDVMNALQGVYIFIIYMCKKNVYQNIMKRFRQISRTSINTNTMELSSTNKDSTKERVSMLAK